MNKFDNEIFLPLLWALNKKLGRRFESHANFFTASIASSLEMPGMLITSLNSPIFCYHHASFHDSYVLAHIVE